MTRVLLEGIVGSTAYGLATPESDVDKLGIYQAPTEDFLGLHLSTEKDFSIVEKAPQPDRTLHELGKFCRLTFRCNPTVTELLWLDDYTMTSWAGEELINMRDCFPSAPLVRSAYMGYAMAQFTRLKERGDFGSDLKKRTAKHARHLARLMFQGYTFYSTGFLPIKLENPEWYHDFGAKVGDGDVGIAEALISNYEYAFDNATPALPADPNYDDIQNLIIDIRKDALRENYGLARL